MKARFLLGLFVIVAGLFVFGIGAHPAHAATAVQLSATDRSNLEQILTITQTALNAVQVQVNNHTVQNPAAMIVTLNGIKGYLLTMQTLLGGPVASLPPATPVATTQPAPSGQSVAQNSGQPPSPSQQSAAPATSPSQETASVSSTFTSRWVFWGILILVVIIAIILAMIPRKKAEEPPMVVASAIQAPPTPAVDDSQTIQSA